MPTHPVNKAAKRPSASRPRKMGRPARDFSARSQILAGAGQAFGARGYGDTSVDDILTAADVSRRTFYRFFRNKDDVFEALYEVAASVLLQSVENAVAAVETQEAKLEAGVEAYLRTQAAAGALGRVLILEPLAPGSRLAARHQETVHQFTKLFQRDVEKVRRKNIDPLLFRALVAAMEQVSLSLQAEAIETDFDIERGKRIMLRIAAATLAVTGESVPPLPFV